MTTSESFFEGYHRTESGSWEIIANHELHGVTPEMIDWWWDHVDTTERYKLWHPSDHVSFTWLVSPSNGHVGAVHRVEEFLNGFPDAPLQLDIRWEDSSEAVAKYDYVLLAKGMGEFPAELMHEYQAAPFGSRMRSHFHIPAQAPEIFVRSLYEHNKQEMANFMTFLPDLYRSEVK